MATPNVAQVVAPHTVLGALGDDWIREYGQAPLDRFPFGTMLVAPCTFNTTNKIALGLADNLATAMIGDAIGAGCRTIVVPGMAPGQWAHPLRATYVERLESWGVEVLALALDTPKSGAQPRLRLASVDAIVGALQHS